MSSYLEEVYNNLDYKLLFKDIYNWDVQPNNMKYKKISEIGFRKWAFFNPDFAFLIGFIGRMVFVTFMIKILIKTWVASRFVWFFIVLVIKLRILYKFFKKYNILRDKSIYEHYSKLYSKIGLFFLAKKLKDGLGGFLK